MPTGGFFGIDSSESGIKQKFNDYATTARKQSQECLTWLIRQHQISRAHVIELSIHMAAGFEKSISQHISPKNPLRKREIFERDEDFLGNIQWLLDNWSEIRSTSRIGVVSSDNRTLNETIELFEIAFRRMATATKSYTTYNIKLQSTQIQQAAIELEKIISANLSIATPAFLDLQKMLHEIIISIQPEQFQRVIILLTSKVAAIMQSQSEADVDKGHLELAKALTQFQEILTSISDETNPMLSLIKKLTTITHQIPQEEMAAYGLYEDFASSWRKYPPSERLSDITKTVNMMISDSATTPTISRLKMLLLQEQSRVQAEILLAEKAAPAASSSAAEHSTIAPLQFAYPATSAPIVGSVEQQTHHARSCSSFTKDSEYVQFVVSATRSAKGKPFTL